MWLQGQYWLWLIAISAALLMSAGFSVLALASSNEQRIRALTMLPLELQSGSPPSFLSRLLLMLLSIALVSFIGALIILAVIGPALFAIFGGLSLFLGKFLIQGWWTRSTACRPMKYVFLFSVALMVLLLFAIADFCTGMTKLRPIQLFLKGESMEVQATLSAFIAAIWAWSLTSAKIVRLVAAQKPERLLVLPLWATQGSGYLVLSIVNFGLLAVQYGLPIAAFVSFPFKVAAAILGSALLLSAVLVAFGAMIRPAILRYFAAAALSVVTGVAYCVVRFG